MDNQTAVAALSALSHESRLAAFRCLVQAGPAGMAVGDLRAALGLPPATLTSHLNVLRQAALVVDQREGRVIRVRASFEHMNALLAYLTANCCAGMTSCDPINLCDPTSGKACA